MMSICSNRNVKSLMLIVMLVMFISCSYARQADWDQLVRNSAEYTDTSQQSLNMNYRVLSFERWDVNQETGELTFSDKSGHRLLTRFQFVGSYSERSKTWLWSWGNASVLPALSKRMTVLRDFGEKHHFPRLTDRAWSATLDDAWQMATIANYLLKAKGIYRIPFEEGFVFLMMTDVQPEKTE